ncbi:MAG TPA: hypothetical protein VNC78_10055 [Actinomycetota bacterium]|nr:hypothetical protein [Actinomycetota bacterium]
MALKRRSSIRSVLGVCLVLILGACGQAPTGRTATPREDPSETTPLPPQPTRGDRDLDKPPPVTIRYAEQSSELEAWTYCFGNVCADGSPPADLVDVGNVPEVFVEFPLPGWTFEASFTPSGEACGRVITVPLEQTGGGASVLRPAGYADTYDVTLFGRGGGDLFVTFRWTTPTDGPLPKPEARLAVLADHDGGVDSYGVELAISNLAETPKSATATVTVRAEDGDSLSFVAEQSNARCQAEGSIYWDGPDDEGLAAARLGGDSFIYEVELLLNGVRHSATARWPEDEIRGNEPSVALEFEPPLPALEPRT